MKLTEKIAVASVAAVLFKFLVAGLSIKFGGLSFDLGTVDAMTVAAILAPTVGAPHLEAYVRGMQQQKQEGEDGSNV